MAEQNKSHPVQWTRRSFCARALAGTAVGLMATALKGAEEAAGDSKPGFKPEELHAMEAAAAALMQKHHVPGLSVAITKEGRLVYAQAFGLADKEKNEKVTTNHLFRIASVSKTITATTIFRLMEDGKLSLSDKVFGAQAILGADYGPLPYKQYVEEITVDQLLTHTAGGWSNDENDPMRHHSGMDQKQLITWTIANQPLENPPGKHFAYSNFGFCILGRVIEKLAGKPYEKAVQELVLGPCGITDMRIGGKTLAERAPREVIYYSQTSRNPYGNDVRRMDALGGWLATATDLARFLVHVDKFPSKPDILKPATIELMMTASAVAPGQARGWSVNKSGTWRHSGGLSGTTALIVRTSNQFCWAAVANTSTGGLDELMSGMVKQVTIWPDNDLF